MEKGGIPPTGVYTMKETPARPLPHIGLRNLKTALSASLCALIYFFLNRNPAFACIGAIFGMGADMDHSKLHGGNRLFGTVIGGFLGIGLYRIYLVFYPDGGRHLLLVPLLFGGIVVLILLAQIFWVGAVQPGGVVLCLLLFSIGPDDYISIIRLSAKGTDGVMKRRCFRLKLMFAILFTGVLGILQRPWR